MKKTHRHEPSNGSESLFLQTVTQDGVSDWQDHLVQELPLDLQLIDASADRADPIHVARLMRTPGHDKELALGFLLTQSYICSMEDVAGWQESSSQEEGQTIQAVTVTLTHPKGGFSPPKVEPLITTTSGGLSRQNRCAIPPDREAKSSCTFKMTTKDLFLLSARLSNCQGLFQSTGSAHACAIFDATGNLEIVREDVGRHNAVDKISGWLLCKGRLPAAHCGLLLSGRVSFDLILKAITCGIPFVAAIGAPTHQATVLAREYGITLVGFLKPNRMNIYSGEHRVHPPR